MRPPGFVFRTWEEGCSQTDPMFNHPSNLPLHLKHPKVEELTAARMVMNPTVRMMSKFFDYKTLDANSSELR